MKRSENCILGRLDLRVVCTNIATPTDVLSINELAHGKFDTGMKLVNIIWMIFGMPTFCTIILFKLKNFKAAYCLFDIINTVGTDGSMPYEKNNIKDFIEM